MLQGRARFLHAPGDPGFRAFQADLVHRLPEELAVLGLFNGLAVRPDELDAEFVQHAALRRLQRRVQRRLAAHGRKESARLLSSDDLRDDLGRDRLDVGRVRHFRIGHDRGGIGVQQNDPVALVLEGLACLCARVVEFAGLADHDRARADDHDRAQIGPLGHSSVLADPARGANCAGCKPPGL